MLKSLFLFRKEIAGFIKNRLYFLVWLFLMIAPVFIKGFDLEDYIPSEYLLNTVKDYFVTVIVVVFLCLYVCDSCKNDFQNGGMLFSFNMQNRIFVHAVAKSVVSGVISFCIMISIMLSGIISSDVLQVFLTLYFFIIAACMAYGINVLLCGTDTISFLIVLLIVVVLVQLIIQPIAVFVKLLSLSMVGIVSMIMIVVCGKNKRFRFFIK